MNDLDTRQLFIEDLARRLHALETGRRPMNALDYRVHARMLRHALAGVPQRQLGLLLEHGPVRDALDNRTFDEHGLLLSAGDGAAELRDTADALLMLLQRRARSA